MAAVTLTNGKGGINFCDNAKLSNGNYDIDYYNLKDISFFQFSYC